MPFYKHYHVKVCLWEQYHVREYVLHIYHCSDLTMELPFTLTHPEPEHKVICGMVTLPRRKSTITVTQNDQQAPVDTTNGQVTDTTATGGSDQPHSTSILLILSYSWCCYGIACRCIRGESIWHLIHSWSGGSQSYHFWCVSNSIK